MTRQLARDYGLVEHPIREGNLNRFMAFCGGLFVIQSVDALVPIGFVHFIGVSFHLIPPVFNTLVACFIFRIWRTYEK